MSWYGRMLIKYMVGRMDGTPLKGKNYFVLRLDSDKPAEAARVSRAMRAYEGKPRNCDVGTAEEQSERFVRFCDEQCTISCKACLVYKAAAADYECFSRWAQMPYKAKEGGAK